MSERPAIDIGALIDRADFRGLPLAIAVFSFLVMIADGFDIQSIAFAAPALAAEWGVRREWLGPVLAASTVGMAAGSFALGWLGDRAGRKTSFCTSVALLTAGSLGSSLSGGLWSLVVFRLVTGVGLGGAAPLAASFVAEWTPRRWRGATVAIVVVAIPLGGMLGAALSREIIPAFGWRSVFLAGAVFPLIFLVAALAKLPESPKFLAGRPDLWPRLAATLNRLVPEHARLTGRERFTLTEDAVAECRGIASLVRAPYLLTTLLLWTAFSCNTLALYGFVNWLPTVLSSGGASLSYALDGSLLFNLGGIVGSIGGSLLILRCGSRRIGTGVAFVGALAALAIGVTRTTPQPLGATGSGAYLLLLVTISGASLNGMQALLYAVAAHSYPTSVRASGVGSAAAVARVGGVLSSVVGSAFFALGLPLSIFFYILAAVIVATAVSFCGLRSHIPATWRGATAGAAAAEQSGTS